MQELWNRSDKDATGTLHQDDLSGGAGGGLHRHRQRDALRQRLDQCSAQLQAFQDRLALTVNQRDTARLENAGLREDVAQLNSKLESSRNSVIGLREELGDAREERDRFQTELDFEREVDDATGE